MTRRHRCRCQSHSLSSLITDDALRVDFVSKLFQHTHTHTGWSDRDSGSSSCFVWMNLWGIDFLSPVLFSSQFTIQKKYFGCLARRCALCLAVCHWKMPCYVYHASFSLLGPFLWFQWGISDEPQCPTLGESGSEQGPSGTLDWNLNERERYLALLAIDGSHVGVEQ